MKCFYESLPYNFFKTQLIILEAKKNFIDYYELGARTFVEYRNFSMSVFPGFELYLQMNSTGYVYKIFVFNKT